MNEKRQIIDFFGEQFAEFRFVPDLFRGFVFQQKRPGGLHWSIAVEQDRSSHALAVQIAATYNPLWPGHGSARPLGIDTGLAELRLRSVAVDASEQWHTYDSSPDGLHRTLVEIQGQIAGLAPPFFQEAERQLLSNKLLQLALVESRSISAEDRIGLTKALEAVEGRLLRLEHPAFIRLRDRLRDVWSPDIPKKDRQFTNRLACDCLLFLNPDCSDDAASKI